MKRLDFILHPSSFILFLFLLSCASTAPKPRMLKLEDLTLEEKIGQMFAGAGHALFTNESGWRYRDLMHQVRDNKVGGLTWFVSNVRETAFLTKQLQNAARVPLLALVAGDHPGSHYRRARDRVPPVPAEPAMFRLLDSRRPGKCGAGHNGCKESLDGPGVPGRRGHAPQGGGGAGPCQRHAANDPAKPILGVFLQCRRDPAGGARLAQSHDRGGGHGYLQR